MNQRIAKRTTGLVDYEELETNVLSAIREGRYRLVSQQKNYKN